MFTCLCFIYNVFYNIFKQRGKNTKGWWDNSFQREDQPSRKLYIGLQHSCFLENVLKFFRTAIWHLLGQTQKRKIFNNYIELPRGKPRSFRGPKSGL